MTQASLEFVYEEIKNGNLPFITYGKDDIIKFPDQQINVMCGSFNPVHHGHIKIAEHVFYDTPGGGCPVWLELSLTNCDKGVITYEELRDRLYDIAQLRYKECIAGVIITNQANFIDKLEVLQRKVTFVCGLDTLVRLVQSKYYQNPDDYLYSMDELNNNCDFLVAPRDGVVRTLDCDRVNYTLLDYVDSGVSSTKIREGNL